MPVRTPSTAPTRGNLKPQITPKSNTYMTKPKAVARAPRITSAALEVMPTVNARMVRMVAKTRFIQICSAWLASWLRMYRQ